MAELTSSVTLPLHADTNPGAPSQAKGPTWSPGPFDSLRLPSGKTIGESSNEEVRTQLLRLNIEGAATDGRNIICGRYAGLLADLGKVAADKATQEFLERNA